MNDLKALYVEDEFSLGKITSDILVRNGYAMTWMQDGSKALGVFKNGEFDICVIDVMLPGMDGYNLTQEIRKVNEEIPIIFLTPRSLTEDVIKGFKMGGNDYLKKPFSIEELIVRMNSLTRRASAKENSLKVSEFKIGQFNFSRSAMELKGIDSKIIKLTHIENELLYQLVLSKNEILRRNAVLQELWGNDSLFSARSMDVFISKLRKYLSGDATISIVNIRGIGYKLIVKD
jgi:DNA-binding response OmpR family regulator